MTITELLERIVDKTTRIPSDELSDCITALERHTGWPLPTDYIAFLERYGRPFFTFGDVSGQFTAATERHFIDYWYGFQPDQTNDILKLIEFYNIRLPSGCTPIAECFFGNLYLLDVYRGGQSVYFWSWDDEQEPAGDLVRKPLYPNMTFLADSFTSFVARLHPDIEDEEISAP